MPAQLYFKDTDGVLKPVPLYDANALTVNMLTSADRASEHPAGTPFDVPPYTPGADGLQIFLDGLLCVKGSQYTETSASSVAFTFTLPADAEVCAVSTTSPDGSVVFSTVTSESRDGILTAGTPFAVPSHPVGSDCIKVFFDGLLLLEGVHYTEVSATAIAFTSNVPADVQITVSTATIS